MAISPDLVVRVRYGGCRPDCARGPTDGCATCRTVSGRGIMDPSRPSPSYLAWEILV
jgi:hypothetical protein